MTAMNERSIAKMMFNPWAIYISTVGDSQPAVPSFYTERGIGINPAIEFVNAEAFNKCNGISYTVRRDPIRFNLTITYSIKEFTINISQFVYGGSKNSAGDTLTFDGVAPPYKALWAETCYSDDGKIVRLHIPKGRSIDTAAFETGDAHLLVPVTFESLPEIDDLTTLATLYFEQ
jgi:hypothetical protein